MSAMQVEPSSIAIMVENFVDREIGESEKHENRELLDENGVYNLHALAAEAYAEGFLEGVRTERHRQVSRRVRERERKGADT